MESHRCDSPRAGKIKVIKRRRRTFRRSGRSLVPAGSRQALPQIYLTGKKKLLPEIYHPEGAGQHAGSRFKWLVSTALAAAFGLGVFGLVMYVSMNMEEGGGVVASFRNKAERALETFKPTAIIRRGSRIGSGKTDRLKVTAKGLSTRQWLLA